MSNQKEEIINLEAVQLALKEDVPAYLKKYWKNGLTSDNEFIREAEIALLKLDLKQRNYEMSKMS